MLKPILLAVLFAVIGLVAFALISPLLFPRADGRAQGAVAFPIIVLVCGGAGFFYGLQREKKK